MSESSESSSRGTGRHRPTQRSDFRTAIVCALQVEYDAVCLLVDEFWDDDDFGQAEGDLNFYTMGRMHNHNVVILLLASMGKTSAASAIANLRMSFTAVQLVLLVGICGGVPSGPRGEILLGDVIVGDEIRLYDYGKRYPDGFQPSENFGYKGSNFNRATRGLLNFLQSDRGTKYLEDQTSYNLQLLQEEARSNNINTKYIYPGASEDKLFKSDYRHKHHQRAPCICRACRTDSDPTCEDAIKASCDGTNCDISQTLERQRLAAKQALSFEEQIEAQRPVVHFGRLASADTVLKSAKDRDKLSQELQVIGFEMEAAGFHNEIPYIVIKSVCDYADSHKAKRWQPFAAATAASACRALLKQYRQADQIHKGDSNGHERDRVDHTPSAIHVIPLFKNERFVGRQEVIRKLREMLFNKQTFSRAALVGLGGVGKTQIGLQLAYLMKDESHDKNGGKCSVLWIPASSMAAFEQACADIAKCIPRPKGAEGDPKKIVKDYFSTKKAGRWFLILDNADDHDLIFGHSSAPGGLFKLLPHSDLGCILATTRDRRVAVGFAETNIVNLSEMSMAEAEAFFRESLVGNNIRDTEEATRSLLECLDRIPLAIAQAAAYINVNQITVHEFLGLLHNTPQDQVSVLGRHFQDSTRYPESQNAIALTWLVSFEKISKTDPAAAKLLAFISCIEPKSIPRSLLPEGDSREQFLHAIGTLLGYSFLTPRQGETYDMHRLVHIAAGVWKSGLTDATNLAIQHIASVFPKSNYQNREKWRAYLPHSLKILQDISSLDSRDSQELAYKVGLSLKEDRRDREAISILERVVAIREKTLNEEHPDRLTSQHMLAKAYRDDGQIRSAILVLEHVLLIRERALSEEHPARLTSQHELAIIYLDDGQTKRAISMLERVVAIREKTLNEGHPDRLASQHMLAHAYLNGGQTKMAISILERIVAIEGKALGEEHPDRLSSQHELAYAYLNTGQTKIAVSILERVVAIREKTLVEEHLTRLGAQHMLAYAYLHDGQIKMAISILERIVAIEGRTLSEEHPDRLSAQHQLARAYHENQQTEKAVPLLEHVVSIRKKTLRNDHPNRLGSESLLARLYKRLDEERTKPSSTGS